MGIFGFNLVKEQKEATGPRNEIKEFRKKQKEDEKKFLLSQKEKERIETLKEELSAISPEGRSEIRKYLLEVLEKELEERKKIEEEAPATKEEEQPEAPETAG